MRKKVVIAALCLAALAGAGFRDDFSSAEWKSEISRGYLPYRRLRYEDFPVVSGRATEHWMHTEGFFHYSYRCRWDQTDSGFTATVTSIQLRSGFDQNKSWKRDDTTETKALIEHEQGHLDIMELHANDFRVSKWPIGSGATPQLAMDDLQQKMKDLSGRIEAESRAEQEKYDLDTNHGANVSRQAAWSDAIGRRLDQAHITFWDGGR